MRRLLLPLLFPVAPRPNRVFRSIGAVELPYPLLDSLPGLTDCGRSDPEDGEVPCATP